MYLEAVSRATIWRMSADRSRSCRNTSQRGAALRCCVLLGLVCAAAGSATREAHEEVRARGLYATFPVEGGHYSVDTLHNNITRPSGVETGFFKGHYGLFVSSTVMYTISFFHYRTFERTLVAGVPNTYGSQDAQLLYSLFASPTRMAYDFKNNRLYVAERRSGHIRILDFPSDQTKTLLNADTQENIRLQYNIQTGSTYPGMDLQIGDDVLYAVDTVKLYRIEAADGNGLADIPYEGAVLTEYSGLTQYFANKGYEFSAQLRSCIYSVAPDTRRGVLYVTVSYARNVILQVPMDPEQPYTSISVLLGDESAVFMGNIGGSIPPAMQNGNLYTVEEDGDSEQTDTFRRLSDVAYPSNILLSFPIHARLSADMNVLYFSEAYPTLSGDRSLFGSLSIRRLVFATGEVDSYAGIDHSRDNTSGYAFIGGQGGSADGEVDKAEFVYPMSFAVVHAEGDVATGGSMPMTVDQLSEGGGQGGVVRGLAENTVGFDTLVVADHSSHSVRRVFAYMDTAPPSSSPTLFRHPTEVPTSSPTATSLLSRVGDGASLLTTTQIVLVLCSCLLCGVGMLCLLCLSKHDPAGREMEMSASCRVLSLLRRGSSQGGRYEEVDESTCSSNTLSEVDLESSGSSKTRWSDVPSASTSTSQGNPSGSKFISSGFFSSGIFGRASKERARAQAAHSLLGHSAGACDEEGAS